MTLDCHKVEKYKNDYEKIYENTIDRLVDYIQLQSNDHQESAPKKTVVFGEKSHLNDKDFFNTFMLTKNSRTNDIHDFLSTVDFSSSCFYQFSKFDILNYMNNFNGLPCLCGSFLTSLNIVNSQEKESKSASDQKLIVEPHLHDNETSMNIFPKIHKIQSSDKSPLITDHSNNNASNNTADKKEIVKHQKQRFVYYVDPRLSENFVSIFDSLKKKSLNKGFQY